jgi:hypothetical protein
MTVDEYDQHLLDNQASFDSWKASQEQASAATQGAMKFVKIRNKWQELADKFAFQNSMMGISQIPGKTKEVADAFDRVVYYLNVNAPTEAIKELDLIPRGETFLTEERITILKNEFFQFLTSL